VSGSADLLSKTALHNFNQVPLHRSMGLELEELRAGFARVAMQTSDFTQGGVGGSVHGGLLAALVDIAMLQAVATMFHNEEEPAGTADLSITYLRPAVGEKVFAEASVLRKGRQLAAIEVDILDFQGELCARGRTLYALRAKG